MVKNSGTLTISQRPGIQGLKMEEKWIAHIADDGRIQTVKEHLEGTALRCGEFAEAFDSRNVGEVMGMLHDIGKYSKAFQKRIRGAAIATDHSTAGAFESKIPVMAMGIMGHHSGLPDFGARTDSSNKATYQGRMQRARKGEIEDYSAWQSEIRLGKFIFPDLVDQKNDQVQGFYIRMLYSCLVDADFLDTEAFCRGKERILDYEKVEKLQETLDAYVDAWRNPTSDINRIRTEILKQCILKGEQGSLGLYTLTVPTGGGKTISSLAFALHHAKKNNLKRIIYVIPYTSIIEQTSDQFSQILGKRNVLEHHSGVTYDENETGREQLFMKLRFATENWDVPIIVTTSVQFFESLYSNKSSKCRKNHNIAESVVIFDEAQMIPLSQLSPCVNAIVQLVKNYKVTAVLCTATQPALKDVVGRYIENPLIEEICPKELYESPIFKRVNYVNIGKKSRDEIIEQMLKNKQVLCIVNNRKSAQIIYDLLENEEGSYHLTTLMYPEHRRRILKEIRERLKSGKVCRVVATSLIEAGVDVDFPCVLREIAGLDSILQAGGRCNREGKRPLESSIVYIFKSEARIPELIKTNIAVTEEILEKFSDIQSEKAIEYYFKRLRFFLSEESGAQDKEGVMKMRPFDFRKIAERFHMIDSNTFSIYIPDGEGEELLKRFHYGEQTKAIIREMGKYAVPVYAGQLRNLEEAGCIRPLFEEKTDAYELLNSALYSQEKGLIIEAQSGNGFFI